jgi:hypothetical protein
MAPGVEWVPGVGHGAKDSRGQWGIRRSGDRAEWKNAPNHRGVVRCPPQRSIPLTSCQSVRKLLEGSRAGIHAEARTASGERWCRPHPPAGRRQWPRWPAPVRPDPGSASAGHGCRPAARSDCHRGSVQIQRAAVVAQAAPIREHLGRRDRGHGARWVADETHRNAPRCVQPGSAAA